MVLIEKAPNSSFSFLAEKKLYGTQLLQPGLTNGIDKRHKNLNFRVLIMLSAGAHSYPYINSVYAT